jgi:hypothetical protein
LDQLLIDLELKVIINTTKKGNKYNATQLFIILNPTFPALSVFIEQVSSINAIQQLIRSYIINMTAYNSVEITGFVQFTFGFNMKAMHTLNAAGLKKPKFENRFMLVLLGVLNNG